MQNYVEDITPEYFEKICKKLSKKYKGKSYVFKGRNAVPTVKIKKVYSEIAGKYFYKNALSHGGFCFAQEIIIDICEVGKMDILKILNRA